jgi:transcription antitermination factor NusG
MDAIVENHPNAISVAPVDVSASAIADINPWFVIWTRSRSEQLVCKGLVQKGIEAFVPTFTKVTRWSDRTKHIEWPLFPGYCFSRFEIPNILKVLTCQGVVAVLSNDRKPIPVPNYEIEALQRLMTTGLVFDPCRHLSPGSMVRVVSGPLSGVVGRLVRRGPQDLLILAVNLLNSGASVHVSAWDIEPL